MNKYVVKVEVDNPEYGAPSTELITVEADSFLITSNGDLKFNLKVGGCIEAFARHEWQRVRRIEGTDEVTDEEVDEQTTAGGFPPLDSTT